MAEELDLLSHEDLQRRAAQGKLSWRGKKIVLDPFVKVEFVFAVEEGYTVFPKLVVNGREEAMGEGDVLFSSGVLQGQIFRFWEENYDLICKDPQSYHLLELKAFVDQCEKSAIRLIWKCPIPRWKPEPFPILQLTDRTGAFANLEMDYGPWGQEATGGRSLTEEERFWEKDLLETGFIKKQVGKSSYYCPLNQVVKSLTFLLDLGWKLLDFRGKRVVRQGVAEWKAEVQGEDLLVKGRIAYGSHFANAQDVLGAFNRREKFIELGSEVGLLEVPEAWESLADEETGSEGIVVRRHHIGLVQEVAALPPEYQIAPWEEVVPGKGFVGKLFAYQQKGLCWLSYLFHSRFSGLLADEMGLGKTLQVIALLSTLELKEPVLIVMPVSLLFHWKKEFERFLPEFSVYCHRGEARIQESEKLKNQQMILTSYSQMREDRLVLEQVNFSAVILDEAQMIKNPETQVAQIVCRLKSPFKLAITGTPVENRYDDLWSIFKFLMPQLLGERTAAPVFERVRKKIAPFILRRQKSEVGLELPEKQEQVVWVDWDPEQRVFYEQLLKQKSASLMQKVQSDGLSSHRMEVLELILRLRQCCAHPRLVSGEYSGESAKFKRVCEDLEEVVASRRKVLVYSQFTSLLTLFKPCFEERGWKYVYLDGQTQDRQRVVEQFQQDPHTSIFLMSLKAGGVGLNLQAADYVFLYDPWWNAAAEQQAIDRAHRFGRQDPVIARKYVIAESIEEKILKLQSYKTTLADQLLDFEEGMGTPLGLGELYDLLLQPVQNERIDKVFG